VFSRNRPSEAKLEIENRAPGGYLCNPNLCKLHLTRDQCLRTFFWRPTLPTPLKWHRATRLVSDACTTPKSSSSPQSVHGMLGHANGASNHTHAEQAKTAFLAGLPLAGLRHEVLVETGDILSVISGLVERYGAIWSYGNARTQRRN
jgi:hypothetical protein